MKTTLILAFWGLLAGFNLREDQALFKDVFKQSEESVCTLNYWSGILLVLFILP